MLLQLFLNLNFNLVSLGNKHTFSEDLRPKQLLQFREVIPLSARQQESTNRLKLRLREILDELDDDYRSRSSPNSLIQSVDTHLDKQIV